MLPESRKGKSVYDIAFSDEYLAVHGFKLWGYSEDVFKTHAETSKEALNIFASKKARFIGQGPLIDPIPQELTVAWGPTTINSENEENVAETAVGSTVQGAMKRLNLFNAFGMTDVRFLATLQTLQGYGYPEMSISTIFTPEFTDIERFINGLITISSPAAEDVVVGNLGAPMGYKVPTSTFSSLKSALSNGWEAKSLTLTGACAVQLGKHRLIQGLMCTGVSIIPSTTYVDDVTPQYFKVNIRLMGMRTFLDSEQAKQWRFNDEKSTSWNNDKRIWEDFTAVDADNTNQAVLDEFKKAGAK